MATEKELNERLGRALTDEGFRALLLEDPLKAAAGMRLSLTDEQLAGLKALDLSQGLEGLDERLSKLLR